MNSRTYDLHSHSDQSDGILSPEALVSRAKRQDVDVLALTDHDTTQGLARAQAQAELEGLEFILGIEFSTQWRGRGVHIVGLNIDVTSVSLQAAIEQQGAMREKRAETIAQKLEGLGFEGALEGAKVFAKDAVLGRPHFAKFLVEQGHCKNIQQAFKKYLGAGKAGDIKQVWPEIPEIVQTIVDSGGVAVLAHPDKYNMTRTKLCAMVEEFRQSGGRAIEVVSGMQMPNVTRDLATIAKKYSLLASCGSDFHVPDQKWQELGQFSLMPDDLLPVWSLWE